jgi:hypothetical protein
MRASRVAVTTTEIYRRRTQQREHFRFYFTLRKTPASAPGGPMLRLTAEWNAQDGSPQGSFCDPVVRFTSAIVRLGNSALGQFPGDSCTQSAPAVSKLITDGTVRGMITTTEAADVMAMDPSPGNNPLTRGKWPSRGVLFLNLRDVIADPVLLVSDKCHKPAKISPANLIRFR